MEIEKAEIWQFPFSLLPLNEFWPNIIFYIAAMSSLKI